MYVLILLCGTIAVDLGKLNFSYGELDPPFSADVYDYVLKVQHCTSLKYHLLSNMMDAGTDSRLYVTFNQVVQMGKCFRTCSCGIKSEPQNSQKGHYTLFADQVATSGETIELRPPFPLKSNANYTVLIPIGAVVGAKMQDVICADGGDAENKMEYWFLTGDPAGTIVQMSVSIGCDDRRTCDYYAGYMNFDANPKAVLDPVRAAILRLRAQPETSRVRRLQESAPNETFMNTPPFEVDDGVDMIAGTPVVEMRSVYQYDVDHLWWLLLIIFPFTNKATGSNWVFLALAVLYFISGLLPVCVSSVIFSLPMTLSIDTRDGLLPAMTAVLPIAANALSFLVLCSEFPRTADAIASAPWQIELGVLVSLCVMLGEMVTDQYHTRDKKLSHTSLMEQHSQVTPLLMMEYKLFMAERSRKGAVTLNEV
eukprot:GEMP01053014.1.p1 GENE.GEMP01053014.1~~GEMP01053014.1.p1  ORF type:complete len:424 (-),score=87.65 GEMP01053014.1:118-1389(-)